jgi:hypothetical protein
MIFLSRNSEYEYQAELYFLWIFLVRNSEYQSHEIWTFISQWNASSTCIGWLPGWCLTGDPNLRVTSWPILCV